MKIRKRDGRVVEVDDGYILQDGEALTVGLTMMDSRRRSMVTDARGRPAGQRPGFLYGDSDIDEARRITAYAEYDEHIRNRWRGNAKEGRSERLPSFASPQAAQSAVEAAHQAYRADLESRWRK